MVSINRQNSDSSENLYTSPLTRSALEQQLGNISAKNYELETFGIKNYGRLYWNLSVPILVEHAIARREGYLAYNGALVVETGKYTGRSPKDKFIVEESSTKGEIDWNKFNVPLSEENFEKLYQRVISYIQKRDLYIFDGYVGAEPQHRYGVRVINELAWHNLFVRQLFIRPTESQLKEHRVDFTVICVPGLHGDPEREGINSEAFVVLNLAKKLVLIGGTYYAGEMKKSIFSLMNYFTTKQNVLPMHCAANIGDRGDTALFFGLSGTGKTTLSADPHRSLIGDDEHGWSDNSIFNFEGGCYAKTIRLSQEYEPQIWSALRFGSLLENVTIESNDRIPDYDDGSLTENTRAAYPLDYIDNYHPSGVGESPETIIFLTADAFGVLPPIAKLTQEQAMYHFLSGYTSKLAGTERGIATPESTFSACFGQCFFPLSPTLYAEILGKKLQQNPHTNVYLVNTGWFGGGYGVGKRIAIDLTRAMVSAALKGELEKISYQADPLFKVLVPQSISGIPSEILNPRHSWQDLDDYDRQARELAKKFSENFQQFHQIREDIVAAGPG